MPETSHTPPALPLTLSLPIRLRAALSVTTVALLATAVSFAFQRTIPPVVAIPSVAPALPAPDPVPRGLPQRAGHFLPYVAEQACAPYLFWDPLYVTHFPEEPGALLVVERRGTVQLLRPTTAGHYSRTLFLNLGERVVLTQDMAEEGLLGLALHPQFADQTSPHRGEIFVYYVGRNAVGPTNRLSRFRTRDGKLDRVDPNSEQILIDQPDSHQAHNGGSLLFGPDGCLYLGVGDDVADITNPNAQFITRNLFSGILRLDVDCRGGNFSHAPPRQPQTGVTAGYYIPNDNPFTGVPRALEEFYAIGLRNPWRMSFDPVNGHLYVGEPGDHSREEVNLVRSGSNCGWPLFEGKEPYEGQIEDPLEPDTLQRGIPTEPLFDYPRDFAHRCVIGGHVYRGQLFPELIGQYVYADQSGRIYALELLDGGTRAGQNRLIAVLPEPGIGISSLGEDSNGELYFCSIGSLASETGRLFRLRSTQPSERDRMPATLAETGVFSDWQNLVPAARFVPFDVNVPLWSDGAEKHRWISVPDGQRVTVNDKGQFNYPDGTVLVKHFGLVTDARQPSSERPLETRILIYNRRDGVFGGTYRWSADGTAATLIDSSESEDIPITRADGQPSTQNWTYPGRFACFQCHNPASGEILGFTLRQLNCEVPGVDGTLENQLQTLTRDGILAPETPDVAAQLALPNLALPDDQSVPLLHRVRSYLEVNCSSCHNPERRFAAFDARIVRDMAETGLIDGASYHHSVMGKAVRIIAPGSLANSMMHLRMSSTSPALRMPPLGSAVVDEKGVALIREWILSLPGPDVAGDSQNSSALPQALAPRDNLRH